MEEARERSLVKKDYEKGLAERRRTEELVRAAGKRRGNGGSVGATWSPGRGGGRALVKLVSFTAGVNHKLLPLCVEIA